MTNRVFRSVAFTLGLLTASSMAIPTAFAQNVDFPSKPVTIVVPFAPGGGVDVVARLLAEKLKEKYRLGVVVDNKPGGSGMIGALSVVRAQPDGHTLLLGSAGETAINPFVYGARMQYAPERDLAPLNLITKIPNVLVINPKLDANNVAELIALAKKKPGRLSYSTSGVGNPQHLNGELLEELAGIFMVHIPYRGASAQLVDVVSGVVDMTFVSYVAAKSFIDSGKVKALAVTSAKRSGFAPNLPALAEEKSIKAYQLENWFGLFAPAKTPDAIQQKISADVKQILSSPEFVKRLNDLGGEATTLTTGDFKAFVRNESEQYARIVKLAKITAE
jgi:tripartite-type tricarboxylate transporter receptor subunit TctC